MRFWYRTMVTVMAAAATFCTAALICLELDLWQWGAEQTLVCDGEKILWSSGLYEGTGVLEDGMLKRIVIERAFPDMSGMP